MSRVNKIPAAEEFSHECFEFEPPIHHNVVLANAFLGCKPKEFFKRHNFNYWKFFAPYRIAGERDFTDFQHKWSMLDCLNYFLRRIRHGIAGNERETAFSQSLFAGGDIVPL